MGCGGGDSLQMLEIRFPVSICCLFDKELLKFKQQSIPSYLYKNLKEKVANGLIVHQFEDNVTSS